MHRAASTCSAWRVPRATRQRAGRRIPRPRHVCLNKLDLITYPNGCHIAEVEIDPDTGALTLERYTAVDDFGTLLNPMLTLGQIQGGVVQGIGQAMLEHTVYDPESGQMLSGSFMDYTYRAPPTCGARHHVQWRADRG